MFKLMEEQKVTHTAVSVSTGCATARAFVAKAAGAVMRYLGC